MNTLEGSEQSELETAKTLSLHTKLRQLLKENTKLLQLNTEYETKYDELNYKVAEIENKQYKLNKKYLALEKNNKYMIQCNTNKKFQIKREKEFKDMYRQKAETLESKYAMSEKKNTQLRSQLQKLKEHCKLIIEAGNQISEQHIEELKNFIT